MSASDEAKNYLDVKELLAPFVDEDPPSADEWKAIHAVMEKISFSSNDGYTIDVPHPETEDQMWYIMRSPDGILMAAFVLQGYDDELSYFAEYKLDDEKLGFESEAYETSWTQLRQIFALLPEDALAHIRDRAIGIDPDAYADMIETLTGERPQPAATA